MVRNIAALLCTITLVTQSPHSAGEDKRASLQAFLGSLKLNDQTANWEELEGEDFDVEFPSSLLSGGIEAEYAYSDGPLRWGLNSGGSIAWKSSDTRVSGSFNGETGGTIRVDIDNSLFLGELHLGAFARADLGSVVQIYAAAGPMIMYGKHEVEDEDIVEPDSSPAQNATIVLTSSDESDFSVGIYARTGIDFRIAPGQQVGLGVRYMKTEMDFSKTLGKIDIEGPQFVLTFSAAM